MTARRSLSCALPFVVLTNEDLPSGSMQVVDLLFRVGLVTTEFEARELIAQGVVKLDGLAVLHRTKITRRTAANNDGRFQLTVGRNAVTVQLPPDRTVAELLDALPFRKGRVRRVIAEHPDDGADLALTVASSQGVTVSEADALKRIDDLVVQDPRVMNGQPVFVGTCVPVRVVAVWIQAGASRPGLKEFLKEWFGPITDEMIEAAPLWVQRHPADNPPRSFCEGYSSDQMASGTCDGVPDGVFGIPDPDSAPVVVAGGCEEPGTAMGWLADPTIADEARLSHALLGMQRAAVEAREFVAGFTKADFMGDKRTRKAVLASFYLLADAATMIVAYFPAYAVDHMEVPWKALAGTRPLDLDVDWDLIWRLVQDDLPDLIRGDFSREAMASGRRHQKKGTHLTREEVDASLDKSRQDDAAKPPPCHE